MFATIIISLIAILFAFLARFKKFSYGLEIAFIILTIFVAIRYNWGNDYSGYLESFKYVGSFSSFDPNILGTEPGWNFLYYISQPIGFFGFTIILTIFEYFVIYRLIKKFVPVEWYWFSIFIFTFNTSYLLVTSSMMRQFLAMCIFIIAIEYIIKKRWIISILLILLASTFHTSALILLPFSFFGYLNISLTKSRPYIWFGVYLLLYFIAVELLGDYFNLLLRLEQFEKYEVYLNDDKGGFGTGLGLIYNMILYFVLLLHQKYQSTNMKIIYILFAISVFFYLFADIAPLTGRLGYYFSIFSIVCYPLLFYVMKNKLLKNLLLVGIIVVTLKGFIDFFDPSGIWFKAFYTYQTIFSASNWM